MRGVAPGALAAYCVGDDMTSGPWIVAVVCGVALLVAGCGGVGRNDPSPGLSAVSSRGLSAQPAAWGISRVAAVQAVSRAVTAANPIMKSPSYAPAESEYGVRVMCRRPATARYRCTWLAVNTYSVLGGYARVHFVRADPRVELRQTSCRRHVGPGEDSTVTLCAAVGYGQGPKRNR